MYQYVLPSQIVLPNTGSNTVASIVGAATIAVAVVAVVSTLARVIAKNALKG